MQLPPPTFSISQGKSSQANDKGLNDGDGDSDSEIGAGNNGDETANNGNNRTATEEAICLGLGKQSTKLVMVHAYFDVLHEKYTTTLKCTIP